MSFADSAKNTMLDALTIDKMSLHTGDPGSSGTSNEVTGGSYARKSCTFGSASSGERTLSSPVDFDGPASTTVTHYGLWESGSPDVFVGSEEVSGDTGFNASGELTVSSASVDLNLTCD